MLVKAWIGGRDDTVMGLCGEWRVERGNWKVVCSCCVYLGRLIPQARFLEK